MAILSWTNNRFAERKKRNGPSCVAVDCLTQARPAGSSTITRNKMVQAKIDQLVEIAQDQLELDSSLQPYQVWMVGDSTMRHQFSVLCSFLAEREGRRFDPCTHPRFSNVSWSVPTLSTGNRGHPPDGGGASPSPVPQVGRYPWGLGWPNRLCLPYNNPLEYLDWRLSSEDGRR